jgi:hypothetical protein
VKLIKERNTYKIFDVAVGKGNGTIWSGFIGFSWKATEGMFE